MSSVDVTTLISSESAGRRFGTSYAARAAAPGTSLGIRIREGFKGVFYLVGQFVGRFVFFCTMNVEAVRVVRGAPGCEARRGFRRREAARRAGTLFGIRGAQGVTRLIAPLVLLSLAAAPTPRACAESQARDEPANDRPFTDFPKGTWTFQTYGTYFNELGSQDVEAGIGTLGASYYFVDNMSLGLELSGFGIDQPGDDAVAVGGGVIFRHHVIATRQATFFLDLAASLFEASEDVPPGGTRFNFIEQAGIGVTCPLRGNAHLLLGVRYLHLSNAQIEGDDRNPSLNGVAAYAGLVLKL